MKRILQCIVQYINGEEISVEILKKYTQMYYIQDCLVSVSQKDFYSIIYACPFPTNLPKCLSNNGI